MGVVPQGEVPRTVQYHRRGPEEGITPYLALYREDDSGLPWMPRITTKNPRITTTNHKLPQITTNHHRSHDARPEVRLEAD